MFWFMLAFRLNIYPHFNEIKPIYGLIAWSSLSLGISYFDPQTISDSLSTGFIVGLIGYGTFNGTELAIRSDWRKLHLFLTDMTWGLFASCMVSVLSYYSKYLM
jgi:uncharacterized membrane protein